MLNNWYKKIWGFIGGRPWTYIARDVYHKTEYFILVGIFTSGFALGRSDLVKWDLFAVLMIVYSLGYVHGHFFWGTEYEEDQEGSE